jgi:Ca2+-binding RTX toxin-like protein
MFVLSQGTANADTLTGWDGKDSISGGAGADSLDGGAGDDRLDGGAGGDWLIGGAGNDIYVVDNAGDLVVEDGGAGSDLVQSSVSYALGANVENLTLTGTAAINGTGNEFDNIIAGNAGANSLTGANGNDTLAGASGNDWLNGGAGDDWLTGGVGLDTFVIQPGYGRDTITDFGATASNQDRLQVSTAVFADIHAFMAAARQAGSDVSVTATPIDVLTLKNITLASLDATDLRFSA